MSVKSFRLIKGIRPVNYDLFFEVDLKNFRFSGKEEIDLELLKPMSRIDLNTKDLKVKNVRLVHKGKTIKPKVKLENENELLILKFPKSIRGPARLLLDFQGKLNDNLLGFHRNKYTKNNSVKYLATTQFEAPYARWAFPCLDEPEYKATFDVSMKISRNLQAISNMPVKEEIADGNKKVIKFHRTPKMSTYLLYLAVGEFEFLEDKLDNVLIRIITTPGKKKQGKFALKLTKKFLSYFQNYSGIPYPLPKLDMIALPDFAAGAMENWGAITFREIYLLFDPKITSTPVKKRIAMIVAHELWHQWSGNLVTMYWWNDLWLNESFATFMAYKAVDHIFPEWNMWEDFVRDETARALDDDSLKTTHPIEVEIENPHQIEEVFDTISYSKGGSVLRMLESYLGEDTFRKGVSDYLSDHKYGNATSEDLWDSLSKVSNKPIKKIMASWIRQAGYPIVESAMENKTLVLKQRTFVFDHSSRSRWLIPLVIEFSNDHKMAEILDGVEKRIELEQKPEWFKLNYGQSGFYKVKYSDENLSRLKPLISGKKLSALDRWGIQNDLFMLSMNGEINIDKYLGFIKSYQNEDNYLVLSSIYLNIRTVYFVFSQEDFWPGVWPEFRMHFKETFNKILDRLGWEPKEMESQSDSLLRDLSIRYLAFVEDPEVLKKGIEKFEGYSKKKLELHPDLKHPIFFMAAYTGNEKVYKKLLGLYSSAKSPEEKRALLIALGQFRNPGILKKVLDFSISDKVKMQDLPIIFSSVASNPYSRSVLLKWVKANWKKLESYKKSGKIFLHIIESFISSYVSNEREIKKFFKTHPVKYKMTVDRSFERVRRHATWLEKNKATLIQYFGK